MEAVKSSLFCLVCFLVCSSEALKMIPPEKISAELGQDVILPCKVPNKYKISNNIAVEWNRYEMDPEYVLYNRGGRLDAVSQHPSYKTRVDLQDKDMKDRDVSLILKNVTKNNTGIYECRVFEKGKNELISIIYLEVVEPGDKCGIIGDGGDKVGIRGHLGVVGVILFLAVVSVGFLIYRRHVRQNPNLPVPPDEVV